jgi:hypothetical protein
MQRCPWVTEYRMYPPCIRHPMLQWMVPPRFLPFLCKLTKLNSRLRPLSSTVPVVVAHSLPREAKQVGVGMPDLIPPRLRSICPGLLEGLVDCRLLGSPVGGRYWSWFSVHRPQPRSETQLTRTKCDMTIPPVRLRT